MSLLLTAMAAAAAAESRPTSAEIAAALARLTAGTPDQQLEASRWLGLNLVDEAS